MKDGTVEIKAIAREAGSRTKIAVWSNDINVDPVGACVGINGARVNAVVSELRGEKIDIINWDDNAAYLIENALSPAKVICVVADEEEREALVIVPDYQLSLAIGKEGQNARLAARLTGYKIDIKSETQAKEQGLFEELGIEYQEDMVDYHYQEDEDFQEEGEIQEVEDSLDEEDYSEEGDLTGDAFAGEESAEDEDFTDEDFTDDDFTDKDFTDEDSADTAKEEGYQEEEQLS